MSSHTSIQFVFLDRDGVINRKAAEGEYVWRWSDFEILPGVESAIARLNDSARRVVVVTNQRGIALGQYSHDDVDRLHEQLQRRLAAHGAHIDGFYVCPHDKGECDRRKPKTGLFRQAFRDFAGACAGNSLMIGDSLADIEAGRSLGCGTIFIQMRRPRNDPDSRRAAALADATVGSLQEAVMWILGERKHACGQGSSGPR